MIEPWEMTREEYRKSRTPDFQARHRAGMTAGFLNLKTLYKRLDAEHVKSIKTALREGKPVPVEVLADYPELTEIRRIKHISHYPHPTCKICNTQAEYYKTIHKLHSSKTHFYCLKHIPKGVNP